MARITRSFRKEMLRAFGVVDALLELAHLAHAERPDFVVSKKTYKDAHRLVTEGVNAARAGQKPRDSQRKSTSFMLGYRYGAVAPSAGPTQQARDAAATGAVAKDDDEFGVRLNRGRPIPTLDSPEAMAGECTGLLTRNVDDRATVEALAEMIFEQDEVQEEPGPEEHPAVAKLWRGIIRGWRLANAGDPEPSPCSLAVVIGFEFSQRQAAPCTVRAGDVEDDNADDYSHEPERDDLESAQ